MKYYTVKTLCKFIQEHFLEMKKAENGKDMEE